MVRQKAQVQNKLHDEILDSTLLAVLSIRTLDTQVTKQEIRLCCFCVFCPVLYPKGLASPGCHNMTLFIHSQLMPVTNTLSLPGPWRNHNQDSKAMSLSESAGKKTPNRK